MNNYSHILNQSNTRLQDICLKSHQIRLVNSILHEYIGEPINEHFLVANIREECVVLEFASAAWATRARFLLPEMLDIVKSKFQDIQKIEWYVHPDNVLANK